MPPLLHTATRRGVTTLTLDSPDNRNALSTPLLTRLREALAAAIADPAVRVVVLDHTGPVFCSGVDLAETTAAREAGSGKLPADEPAPTRKLPAETLADLLAELWECPKPVVARVAGPARAGGLGLIAAADIAICAQPATFAFTEVRLGVIPAVISATVLRRVDRRAAARYYLTGEIFDGARAAAMGLVSEAVPEDELDLRVAGVCDALIRGAPAALAGAKRLLHRRPVDAVREDVSELSALSATYFRSDDAAEGMAAARARRDPSWVP